MLRRFSSSTVSRATRAPGITRQPRSPAASGSSRSTSGATATPILPPTAATPGSTAGPSATPSGTDAGAKASTSGRCGRRSPAPPSSCAAPSQTCCRPRRPSRWSTPDHGRDWSRSPTPVTPCRAINPRSSSTSSAPSSPHDARGRRLRGRPRPGLGHRARVLSGTGQGRDRDGAGLDGVGHRRGQCRRLAHRARLRAHGGRLAPGLAALRAIRAYGRGRLPLRSDRRGAPPLSRHRAQRRDPLDHPGPRDSRRLRCRPPLGPPHPPPHPLRVSPRRAGRDGETRSVSKMLSTPCAGCAIVVALLAAGGGGDSPRPVSQGVEGTPTNKKARPLRWIAWSRRSHPRHPAGDDLRTVTQLARGLGPYLLHRPRLLVRIPLLFPWIGVHVIAVLLPESRWIHVEELEGAQPLGRLPEVELRDHQAHRPAMIRLDVAPVVLEGEQHVVVPEILERRVGGVVGIGVLENPLRLQPRLHLLHDPPGRHTFPFVVELRPAGHAVDARAHGHARQPPEFLPRPGHLAFDEPEAPERPARGVEARGEPVGEDGPLGGQRLARGDAVRDGRIDAAHAMPPELPENSGHWPAPTIIWTP